MPALTLAAAVDQADIAAAIHGLARQRRRGRTNELTLTPAGRPPAPWC